MQTRTVAIVLALSTLSAGAIANTFVDEGTMQPTHSVTHNHALTRAEVQAQAGSSIPLSRDRLVAEGLRAPATQVSSSAMTSRDRVRSEAQQANRASYGASAQANEGV
jgi:hypothetical protein